MIKTTHKKRISHLYQTLADVLGAKSVSTDESTLVCYGSDTNPLDSVSTRNKPDIVVLPRTAEEVATIMKLANSEKMPVTPRGAGTSRVSGSVPLHGGILIDMNLMNHVLEVNEQEMWAKIQPGCTFATLSKELEKKRLALPIEPDSFVAATIGGNVSTDGGGWQLEKYGGWTLNVISLEVVLPTGQIVRTGRNVHKSASGYNLASLFIGSEGTLGIITEITLRVICRPEKFEVKYIGFESIEAAVDAVEESVRIGMIPAPAAVWDETRTAEFLSQEHLKEALKIRSIAVLGFSGCVEEVAACCKRALQICSQRGGTDLGRHMKSETTKNWGAFRSPPWPASGGGRRFCSESAIVPPSEIRQVVSWYKEIASRYGVRPEGCTLLLGPFRPGAFSLSYSFDDSSGSKIYEKFCRALLEKILETGGSITYGGTGGIGGRFVPFLLREHGPEAVQLMKAIKNTLDPNQVLNPGKIFEI